MLNEVSDRQVKRHQFRVALFTRRNVEPDRAWLLADQLLQRDADLDERRIGLECKHLQRTGHCFAAQQGLLPDVPRSSAQHYQCLREQLQRCPAFEWVTP
jgi:hypothetical protein